MLNRKGLRKGYGGYFGCRSFGTERPLGPTIVELARLYVSVVPLPPRRAGGFCSLSLAPPETSQAGVVPPQDPSSRTPTQ